ncbi:MAG: DNA polymerase III subunit gamma/tau [Clostridiales bacterium]|nr:DNA polymerase III subunit gamma/tau [Clostridiales bacterium]
MSEYQALYRAWRPDKFRDIYGQERITTTLINQLESGRISHAYLFCGSRGTGKTTTAKVLARALNCEHPVDGEPCGECRVCRGLKEESSLDVMEIDAASNNGVDEVRTLRDRIAYPPTLGKYKVYIIDEVHMLSSGAFNALLKTLEEPPAHAVFILATTEPQKLPATVISRCQRFDFKRISVRNISARLNEVLAGIGRSATAGAVEEIASAADGGMRDALSLLDMCLSYTDGEVDEELVRRVLGSNGRDFMFRFTDALEQGDADTALKLIASAMEDGRDPQAFTRETAAHLRNILIAGITGEAAAEICQVTEDTAKRLTEQAKHFETNRLLRSMDMFIKAEGDMRYAANPRSVIEMCAVRSARVSREKTPEGLTERLEALEKRLQSGTVTVSASRAAEKDAPAGAPAPEAAKQETPPAPGSDGEKFARALAAYESRYPRYRGVVFGIRYVKTDGNTVVASLPKEREIMRDVIKGKTPEIEAELTFEFGREIKLVLAQDAPAAARPALSGRDVSTIFDIFQERDKINLVD